MEENAKICQTQVRDFFERLKAKKHPPPEEKLDPVKAKHTVDALKKPPKSPPKGNYERIIEKFYRSGAVGK